MKRILLQLLLSLVASSASADGLTGLYYGNENFLGKPALIRVDRQIAFDFADEYPISASGDGSFSAVWTGQLRAVESGSYRFCLSTDAPVRFWLGGRSVTTTKSWTDPIGTHLSGEATLDAGKRYEMLLFFSNPSGKSKLRLEWEQPSGVREVIPSDRLTSYGGSGFDGRYIDPEYLTLGTFGAHSHYLQPWRAYLETRTASDFLRHVGVVCRPGPHSAHYVRHLAENGIRSTRFEIPWSSLDYENPQRFKDGRDALLRDHLQNLKQYDIRPALLLNGHHGWPCPARSHVSTITSDAESGACGLSLDNVSGTLG